MSSDRAVCTKCGTDYSRRKGYFPVSYSLLHKGIGYIPVCKDCIDKMYNGYLSQCNSAKYAVRQICRKLDLYWSESVYSVVSRKSTTRSMMTQYIAKINSVTYAGKSYDDTLSEEGTLWSFIEVESDMANITYEKKYDSSDSGEEQSDAVSDEMVAFWGSGYSPSMYAELEQRRTYYISKFPKDAELDVGFEILIRQICNLEVNIARDSAAGKSIDKSVNSLNTLLGSLNIKPTQKKFDDSDSSIDKTPLGIWAQRIEYKRPIKEIDPELQDVDEIKKYVSIWFLGHLCKMLGIKNSYCKLYEEEIAKMRIEHPEYEDEDDETMFNDIFCSDGTDNSDGDSQ